MYYVQIVKQFTILQCNKETTTGFANRKLYEYPESMDVVNVRGNLIDRVANVLRQFIIQIFNMGVLKHNYFIQYHLLARELPGTSSACFSELPFD
jgi:hypothetical protein